MSLRHSAELPHHAPRSANSQRAASRSDVGDGSWAVDDGTGRNTLLGYSDLRLLAGLNLWSGSGRELTVELGYVFSRDLAVAENSVYTPSDTWLAQLTWVF